MISDRSEISYSSFFQNCYAFIDLILQSMYVFLYPFWIVLIYTEINWTQTAEIFFFLINNKSTVFIRSLIFNFEQFRSISFNYYVCFIYEFVVAYLNKQVEFFFCFSILTSLCNNIIKIAGPKWDIKIMVAFVGVKLKSQKFTTPQLYSIPHENIYLNWKFFKKFCAS